MPRFEQDGSRHQPIPLQKTSSTLLLGQHAPVTQVDTPKAYEHEKLSPWMKPSRNSVAQQELKHHKHQTAKAENKTHRATSLGHIPRNLLSPRPESCGDETDATAAYRESRSPNVRFQRLPMTVVSVAVAETTVAAAGELPKPSRGCRMCRGKTKAVRFTATLDLGRGLQEKFTHRFSDWLKVLSISCCSALQYAVPADLF